MRILVEGDTVVVALVPGEEIVASLRAVAEEQKIQGGWFGGLGSTSDVEIAFFDPQRKEYLPRRFEEPMEIGSLVGVLSMLEGEPHVHAHVTVSGTELIAFTGHLNKGVVGTACEIWIRRLKAALPRVRDAAAGFNPLQLP